MNNLPTLLASIKARLSAATPGPWSLGYSDGSGQYQDQGPHNPDETAFCIVEVKNDTSVLHAKLVQEETGKADAELIAHAPTDIARLIKALEYLLKENGSKERREFLAEQVAKILEGEK